MGTAPVTNSMAGAAGKLNEDISLVLAAVNQQFSKGQTMVKTVMYLFPAGSSAAKRSAAEPRSSNTTFNSSSFGQLG